VEESKAELGVTTAFGVLNAPVEALCRRSNSSCSFGGRRGGAGPVAKAVLLAECMKNLREGRRNFGGRSRDMISGACNEASCNTWIQLRPQLKLRWLEEEESGEQRRRAKMQQGCPFCQAACPIWLEGRRINIKNY
jgi:hypothetical protein